MPDSPDCLLLVEDDRFIAQCLQRGLEASGHPVVTADCGAKALALLDADATGFWCIVTDIDCGDAVSGWQVGRRARSLNPDVEVIYMTGNGGSMWKSEGVERSLLLEKPFDSATLVGAVRRLACL